MNPKRIPSFPSLSTAAAFGFALLGSVLFLQSCGGAEKDTLTKQVAEFQGKTLTLEKTVGDRDARIAALEAENKDLAGRMPAIRTVSSGDSHWQIAYDFLTQTKNVPPEEARALLAETILDENILIGYRIGNVYSDGVFGTFLAQGEADLSPLRMRRREIRVREEKHARMTQRIAEAERQAEAIGKKSVESQKMWTERAGELDRRIKSLEDDLTETRSRNAAAEAKLNSVYYLVGSRAALKAAGIIKGSFLGICGDRVKNVTPTQFVKSLDLRSGEIIPLTSAEGGLDRIKSVRLFPAEFREGLDYRVERAPDGTGANVYLLKKEKFRLARVIVSVE